MLSNERKRQLAGLGVPSEADACKRTKSFMLRSGLTNLEMADAIGYSPSTLCQFLNGSYCANHPQRENSLNLRAVLKQYIDLHDLQAQVILRGKNHETADFVSVRRSALNALDRGTAYLVDGPPGTQKTWILRQVEREINSRQGARAVYVYARADHSPGSFLTETCVCAGIPSRGNIDQLLRKLRFYLGQGRTLLMVDEAQHLGISGLEVLRQLLDLPPYFGVVLAGSHDLSQRLSHWQMEQWRSRLRKKHYLNGLSEEESERILVAELGRLSPEAIRRIIADSRSEASRDGKKFTYISARNLFDAIDAAKRNLKGEGQ